MRNEKGLTLVELLAVIVILAIVGIIAFVSVSKIINNAKADAHLENARSALEVGKLAYIDGLEADKEHGKAPAYSLKALSEAGYLSGVIKNPSFISGWNNEISYDMEESIVVYNIFKKPPKFQVNLDFGGGNKIFDDPLEEKDIKRENLTDRMKQELNIKE